jgi:hypothetical protein
MYKILRVPHVDTNKNPTLPLLIVLNDGCVFESDSIESTISILTNGEYIKLEPKAKYLKRIEIARKEAMYALQYELTVLVSDGKNTIDNNYARDLSDDDYKYTEEELKNSQIIRVDDEKEFITSLVKIGSFRILERADSNIFLTEKSPGEVLNKEYIDISLTF